MIVIVTILLLLLSPLAIYVLWVRKRWLGRLRYPLARFLFALLGVGILLLGICFFQRGWFMSAFFGMLFSALGVQIALWAIGVSLDFLGNKPIIFHEQHKREHQERRKVFLAVSRQLDAVIALIQYASRCYYSENSNSGEDNAEEKSKEMTKAIRVEIENILQVIFNNPDFFSEDRFNIFIRNSPTFRFEPPHIAEKELDVLKDFRRFIDK
jgi:hypothetical protein